MRTFVKGLASIVLFASQLVGAGRGQVDDKTADIQYKRARIQVKQVALNEARAGWPGKLQADIRFSKARLGVATAYRKQSEVLLANARKANASLIAEFEITNQLRTAEEKAAQERVSASEAKLAAGEARVEEANADLLVAKLELRVAEDPRRQEREELARAQLRLCEMQLASAEAHRTVADTEIAVAKADIEVARISLKKVRGGK